MLKNLTNTLSGLKRKKPDSCYEQEEDNMFVVDCDVRLEQGGTEAIALVRLVRKTTVSFCCAGGTQIFVSNHLPGYALVTLM